MKAIDCPYLITNARWGMGVERMDLRSRASLLLWFLTAGCGSIGFIPGPAEALTWADLALIHKRRRRYRLSAV